MAVEMDSKILMRCRLVVDDDGDDCGVVLFYLWVLDDAGDNALQSYIKLY